jgi:hypothetical protein
VTAAEVRARAHTAAVERITQDQRFGVLSTAAVRTLVSVTLNAALPIVGEGYTDEVKTIVDEAKAEMESKFVDMVAPAIEAGITQALAEERAVVGPQIEALQGRIRELEAAQAVARRREDLAADVGMQIGRDIGERRGRERHSPEVPRG